jgi:hypothetical protein
MTGRIQGLQVARLKGQCRVDPDTDAMIDLDGQHLSSVLDVHAVRVHTPGKVVEHPAAQPLPAGSTAGIRAMRGASFGVVLRISLAGASG